VTNVEVRNNPAKFTDPFVCSNKKWQLSS